MNYKGFANSLPAFLLFLLFSSLSYSAAANVPLDLLRGWGSFEQSSFTTNWDSVYAGSDYDFEANNLRVYTSSGGGKYGMRKPTPDDTVALGWRRASGETVNPGRHIVYRLLTSGGVDGSGCQYFGLKDLPGKGGWATLQSRVRYPLYAGDQLTFRIDHIRMISSGTPLKHLHYRLRIFGDVSNSIERNLNYSATPTSGEVSLTLTTGTDHVTVEVQLICSTAGGGGVYVDGAHLFVRRGTQGALTHSVPATPNRSIKTFQAFYTADRMTEVDAAENYDIAMLGWETDYISVPKLKAINPNIRVYLYMSPNISRPSKGSVDDYYSNSPVGYFDTIIRHPEWLYSDGFGKYVNEADYPLSYYAKIANPEYQQTWVSKTIERARAFRCDGVFIDGPVAFGELREGAKLTRPKIEEWEVQSFLHAVVPMLKAAGLDVIQNQSGRHIDSGPGQVYFDPFWVPSPPYNTSMYRSNSVANTPNGFFQETAFKGFTTYDEKYWWRCLSDMATVLKWNTATGDRTLSQKDKKYYYCYVVGLDTVTDPAYGIDGWLNFGLCSYLLGQNEYTVFGCGTRYNPLYMANIDYSITKKLGMPSGDHQPIDGDQYFRYREYVAAGEDSVGGVVVVNGRTNTSRTYRVDFDAVDQSGKIIPAGSNITLKPHTGRILLRGQSNVELTVDAPTQGVRSGQVIDIVVAYKNNGSAIAREATVRASVPAQMTYVPGSGEASGGTFDVATNTVNWNVGTLAIGQGGFRTFKARIK